MTFRLCAALFAAALLVTACMTKPAPQTSVLFKSSWAAVAIDGDTVPDSMKISLDFGDGKITGSGGCNHYFGAYAENGDSLKISGIGSTKMACAAPVMARESAYLTILGEAASYTHDDRGGIVVTGKDGRTLAFLPNAS